MKWFHRWRLKALERTHFEIFCAILDLRRGEKSVACECKVFRLKELDELIDVTRRKAGLCIHPWKGDGPVPPSFYCACGTKVYRSYEDYCWD